MKAGDAIVVMSLLGTFSQAAKLLKVPRIYNALITTDEKLQPSQAFPALSPVIHGIPYPVPTAYIAYQPLIPIPFGSAPGGRSFSYAIKQDSYSFNYFQNDIPLTGEISKISEIKAPFDQSILFSPTMTQNVPKEVSFTTSDVKMNLKNLPYPSKNTDQINEFQGYPPVRTLQTANQAFNYSTNSQNDQIVNYQANGLGRKNPQISDSYQTSDYDSTSLTDKDDSVNPENSSDFQEDYLPISNTDHNNRSNDLKIVDIPPPPLPNRKQKENKKKPEEYPPPPVGYIL